MNLIHQLSMKSIINLIYFKCELLFNVFEFVVLFSVKKSKQKRTKKLNTNNNRSAKKKSSKVGIAFILFTYFYY